MYKHEHAALLRDVYRDLVLSLGSIASVRLRRIPDDALQDICRTIKDSYLRHRNRYVSPTSEWRKGGLRPHPDLVRLLEEIRSVA